MRHALLVLLILTGAGPALGQRLLPLVENGPAADRLNVVVVAEGYTAAQETAFQDDAGAFLDDLFQAPPYDAYAPYFNAYGLFAASAESGADHPARNLFRDTYFDAYYDCAGIARLICLGGGGHSRLNTLLADLMPEYDLVLVLVNDPEYGGSGGQFAISSTHPSASEIAIHELGHSFAGLRDTYESGGLPPAEGPNATAETRRTHIRWTHWIDASTPLPTPEIQAFAGDAGLFEGAVYTPTGWYRPRLECKMRSLGQPFCEVCTEYHIAAIYDRLSPVEDYAPAAPALVVEEGAVELRVTPRAPALHALAVQWYVDGAAVAGATGTVFTVEAASLPAGPVTVEARVTDPTPLVRDALLLPLLEDRVVWEVRRGAPVPAAPVLAAPEDGVPAGGVEPTFAWQAVPGAEAYHLQVAADSTFQQLVFDGDALAETEKTVGPLAYDFTFFWRVRARGEGGFGPWSAVRRYTTSVPPPALIAPEDGVQGGSAHVFFAWQAMPNAQSYHLQIAEDEDFGRLVFDDAALARPETAAGPLAYGSTFFWRVRARGAGGFGPWSAVRRYTTGVGTAAEPEDGAAPPGYELAPAYPNPFSAEATIRFGLPAAGPVRLAVYDARGRRVAVLAEGVLPAGRYRVRWQPGTLPDGVYLYRLDAGGRTATGRMVLLR